MPPRKRSRDEDWDDDDDRPRRRRKSTGGTPVWVWFAAGGVLFVVVALGVFFGLRAAGKKSGTHDRDDWVKMAPTGTGMTFEFPTQPEVGDLGIGDNKQFGERLYACKVDRDAERPIIFSAIISFHAAHDAAMPEHAFWKLAKQKLAVGEGDRWQRLMKQYQIQGRDALVYRSEAIEKVVLMVFEPGKTCLFEVVGPGVTDTDPQVQRFFDSVQFTD